MSPLAKPGTILEAALKGARRQLVHAGVMSFFVNILMLAGPIYMLQIYDRVLSSGSQETLAVITLLTLGLFTAMALLDHVRTALLARAGDDFEGRLQGPLFDHAMDQSATGSPVPEQALRDLRAIRQFVASPALTAVFDAPWIPFFLTLVFLMHWLLGIVALIGLIALIALAMVTESSSRESNRSAQGVAMKSDLLAQSSFRNAGAADAMGMRGALRRRWLALTENLRNTSLIASDRIGGLSAVSRATRLFLQSAILGAGAFLAIKGEVSPGVMIAASIITGRALAPAEIVTGQWRSFAATNEAFRRLQTLIGDLRGAEPRTALPAPKGAITVERLYCRPGAAKTPVLKNLNFAVNAGDVVGIIGPSAAGKSTLARTLVGVEKPLGGEVRLDGASLQHWDADALGPHIGYLPQEIELFGGSAAQNIARFSENQEADKVIAAAKAAGAHDMIQAFPDGYDTEIGDRGRHLSSGQRQRLALARALYGDPALVVLDEPNSNLDAEGDAALTEAVKNLKARGATVVIVAHRPAAIAFVDKLLLLVDGELKAYGPRDEVLKRIAPKGVAPFNPPLAAARQKGAAE
jgi:PrtD family type I secretion system ABC transporter